MSKLIENISSKKYTEAQRDLTEKLEKIAEHKINEVRKMVAARLDEVTVHPDGYVHTSTNERIFPSVARHRRWLA